MATHTVDYNSENPKEKKKAAGGSFLLLIYFLTVTNTNIAPYTPHLYVLILFMFFILNIFYLVWTFFSSAVSMCTKYPSHFNSPCRISYATRHTPGPFVCSSLSLSIHIPPPTTIWALTRTKWMGQQVTTAKPELIIVFAYFFIFSFFFFWPVMGGSIAIDSNERARTPRSKKEETINILTGGHC